MDKPKLSPNTPEYPMRINKYLARKGLATRKGVDELIKSHKVLINKKVAVLGDKVNESDVVELRGRHDKKELVYLAYNKPAGIVTSNPQGNEKDILQSFNFKTKVFPVGRLDKDSEGLIILTNDGRITDRLLNPENHHEKEYVVKVDKSITADFIKKMGAGVVIDDYKTRPTAVKKLGERIFSIVLTEGKNRQIRRMVDKLKYMVIELKRVRVQNIKLGQVPANSYREITGKEKEIFLKSLGLKS
jgi:23S rRNA pseudouridine2604 synthase